MVRADTLSEEKREGILRALGKFRQRILWKYENETLPNQPENVIIRKWMPQREILCNFNNFFSSLKFFNGFLFKVIKMLLFS